MWSNGKTHGLMFLGAVEEQANGGSLVRPVESKASNAGKPSEIGADGGSLTIQDVLEEARTRIAHIAGVPAETVRLKLEIDF
jgi:hypothetical protein